MKKLMGAAAAALLAALCMGACRGIAKGDDVQTDAALETEPVNLKMYLVGEKPTDMDMVLEELNKHMLEDLGCTLSIDWIGWGDYEAQYSIVLSTAENVDLIYTANWLNFGEQAKRGAYAPLEDLLQQYAPQSLSELTADAREDCTVDGHLYALPANYMNYNLLGPIVRGDLMEKYQISPIETFEDYLDFCDVIVNQEGIDPMGLCSMDTAIDDIYLMNCGYYPVTGSTESMYFIDLGDSSHTVYFRSECPVMKDFLTQVKTWKQKGYWADDALVSKDETLLDSGKAASRIHNLDAYYGEYGVNREYDLQYYNLAKYIVRQPAIQDAMAIPAASEHKELAMRLLEKLRNDETYYMLLTYGIEGYHYAKEGKKIEFLNEDYGNEPGTWGFREEKYKCWDSELSEEAIQLRQEYEEEAIELPISNLDLSNIRDEYNQIREISSVYYTPLKLGYLDYETGIALLNDKLQEAGNEEVKKEIQKQVNEAWQKQVKN